MTDQPHEQHSGEWHQARCGKLTASRFSDAMARIKTGWGAGRATYRAELVVERLTGQPYPHYVSRYMQDGTANEPLAVAEYSLRRDIDVVPVGFIPHPTIAMTGGSPDGFVSDVGMIEVKCPASHTHLSYLDGGDIPQEYVLQMKWNMICAGKLWCDWVSFDPRMPAWEQMEVRRVVLTSADVRTMEEQALEFLLEVDRAYERRMAARRRLSEEAA